MFFAYLCHQRKRDPKLSLLAEVTQTVRVEGSQVLHIRYAPGLSHVTSYGIALAMLRRCPAVKSISADKYRTENFQLRQHPRPIGAVKVIGVEKTVQILESVHKSNGERDRDMKEGPAGADPIKSKMQDGFDALPQTREAKIDVCRLALAFLLVLMLTLRLRYAS